MLLGEHTIVPPYPWGIDSVIPLRYQNSFKIKAIGGKLWSLYSVIWKYSYYHMCEIIRGEYLRNKENFHTFLLPVFSLCLKRDWAACCSVTKSCLTLLQPHGLEPTRLLCPWDLPGKNTGVGCSFLLQGIFPTQGANPALAGQLFTTEPLGKPLRWLKFGCCL